MGTKMRFAGVAQLVEQRFRKAQVVGSSPIPGSDFEFFILRYLCYFISGMA